MSFVLNTPPRPRETPKSRRKSSLDSLKRARIEELEQFSEGELVALMQYAMSDAFDVVTTARAPGSNVEDCILIVEAQCAYFARMGFLPPDEATSLSLAFKAHRHYLDTLRVPDADVEPVDLPEPPVPEDNAVDLTDTGTFANVSTGTRLEALSMIAHTGDYFRNLKDYVFYTKNDLYKAAAGVVVTCGLIAFAGPLGLPAISFAGAAASLPLGIFTTIAKERDLLRKIDVSLRGKGVGGIYQRLSGLDGMKRFFSSYVTDADVVATRTARFDAVPTMTSKLGEVPGLREADKLFYEDWGAKLARELYVFNPKICAGGAAVLVGALVADVVFRYRPARCRTWIELNSKENADAYVTKIRHAFAQTELMNAFQSQPYQNKLNRRKMRDDAYNWITFSANEMRGKEPKDLFNPCSVQKKIEAFVIPFEEDVAVLKASPFNFTETGITALDRFYTHSQAWETGTWNTTLSAANRADSRAQLVLVFNNITTTFNAVSAPPRLRRSDAVLLRLAQQMKTLYTISIGAFDGAEYTDLVGNYQNPGPPPSAGSGSTAVPPEPPAVAVAGGAGGAGGGPAALPGAAALPAPPGGGAPPAPAAPPGGGGGGALVIVNDPIEVDANASVVDRVFAAHMAKLSIGAGAGADAP